MGKSQKSIFGNFWEFAYFGIFGFPIVWGHTQGVITLYYIIVYYIVLSPSRRTSYSGSTVPWDGDVMRATAPEHGLLSLQEDEALPQLTDAWSDAGGVEMLRRMVTVNAAATATPIAMAVPITTALICL